MVRIFLLATFVIGSNLPSYGNTGFQRSIKIQVKHSHNNGHSHHHDSTATKKTVPQSKENEEHSHDCYLSCSHAIYVDTKAIVSEVHEIQIVFTSASGLLAPPTYYLGSIFRPPIFA